MPLAQRSLDQFLENAKLECPALRTLASSLLATCAVRLPDILDHILLPRNDWDSFVAAGWKPASRDVLHNPQGHFPDVVESECKGIAVCVESVERFLATHGLTPQIEGEYDGPYRRALAWRGDQIDVLVVERNGHVGYGLPSVSATDIRSAQIILQKFRSRRRQFDSVERGLTHLEGIVDAALKEVTAHVACHAFFRAEREFWQSRCAVARLQFNRQEMAGIGWCNIDHHTFDASRAHFAQTIRILEKLGYECRELLYAGHEAGWGSQILEQPVLRTTIFADIDLAPSELDIDFAHMHLSPLEKHRRAGIWCALHGESALEAGLNHVAGLYDQQVLRSQLRSVGVKMMAPFSKFSVLYQELSEGEWWAVDPQRVDELQRQGQLDQAEAEDFRLRGAIGAHFENIERNNGFKGFNQPGIDGVLRIIDPRHNLTHS